MVTASRQLKFLKVELHWGAQPSKGGGMQNTRFTASLVEKHCATTGWIDESAEDAAAPEVSHLLALPSVLDATGKDTVPPMIISVRTRAANSGSYPVMQSIIDRWEAVEQRHNLQSAVEQLGNRRNSISSEPSSTTRMRPLESVAIDKCVVGLQSSQFGRVIILSFSDGSVQHRDRFTFNEIYTERAITGISSLCQVGWAFPSDSPCKCYQPLPFVDKPANSSPSGQEVVYSPTYCSMVQVGDKGKLRWSKLYYTDGDIGDSMKDGTLITPV